MKNEQTESMNVFDAIVGRQSIREFDRGIDVPRNTIEEILAVAGRSASGSNIQPWKVWIVRDKSRDMIATACYERHMAGDRGAMEYNYYPLNWHEPYISRRRENGWGLYGKLGIEKGDKKRMKHQHGRNYLFFDAPVGLFFTIDRDKELGSWIDCGMFIQSVMLAARGKGLETCAQAAFCSYHDTVTQLLGVPENQMLICGMSLGYPLEDSVVNTFRTSRIKVSEFSTFVDELNVKQ